MPLLSREHRRHEFHCHGVSMGTPMMIHWLAIVVVVQRLGGPFSCSRAMDAVTVPAFERLSESRLHPGRESSREAQLPVLYSVKSPSAGVAFANEPSILSMLDLGLAPPQSFARRPHQPHQPSGKHHTAGDRLLMRPSCRHQLLL